MLFRSAWSDDPVLAEMLDCGGEYAFRVRGEEHMWTPDVIAKLQHSTRSGKYDTYKEYAKLINDQLLGVVSTAKPAIGFGLVAALGIAIYGATRAASPLFSTGASIPIKRLN